MVLDNFLRLMVTYIVERTFFDLDLKLSMLCKIGHRVSSLDILKMRMIRNVHSQEFWAIFF